MRKKIRTAVIGAGNMGKHHLRVYNEISQLVGIADIARTTGEALAAQYHINYYSDYQTLIEKENLEAVSIAVPTYLHTEIALYCLKKNIPTLVEKPIASTLKEANAIYTAAKKRKVFLMVGHIERFNPVVRTLKKLIDQGRLGKIISLLAIRVGMNPPRIPNSDVLLDLGIHDIDICNYLLNEFPIRKKIIKTKLFTHNKSDTAIAILEYKKQTAIIQTNWITPVKMRKLYVSATEGYAELDYVTQKLILYDKPIVTKQVGDFFELVSLSDQVKREVYISRKEPLKAELQYFLSQCHTKRADIEEALEALKIANA